MLPEDRNIPTVNTLIGPVARGSVLHKPCSFKDFKWLAQILSPPVLRFLTSHPNPAMNRRSNESGHVPTQTNSNLTDGHFTNRSEISTDGRPQAYTH